jgi:hypothetical protein
MCALLHVAIGARLAHAARGGVGQTVMRPDACNAGAHAPASRTLLQAAKPAGGPQPRPQTGPPIAKGTFCTAEGKPCCSPATSECGTCPPGARGGSLVAWRQAAAGKPASSRLSSSCSASSRLSPRTQHPGCRPVAGQMHCIAQMHRRPTTGLPAAGIMVSAGTSRSGLSGADAAACPGLQASPPCGAAAVSCPTQRAVCWTTPSWATPRATCLCRDLVRSRAARMFWARTICHDSHPPSFLPLSCGLPLAVAIAAASASR